MNISVEIADKMRQKIKSSGFKARVRISPGRDRVIQVISPTYETRFTPEQIELFCNFALEMGFTFVRNTTIDIANQKKLTDKIQWDFYF
jgi:hypothetical protein